MDLVTRAIASTLLIGFGTLLSPRIDGTKRFQGTELSSTFQSNGQEKAQPPADRPNPDASGVYHAGNGVTPPRVIYSANPEFTDEARKKKINGNCIVGMTVDANGEPQDVHIVRSIGEGLSPKLRSIAEGLDANAIEAAKRYKFKPAKYQGKAVPFALKIEVSYSIY